MARRKLTVDRHEEIKRRLADGRSVREIATALGCSRRLVRQIRDGKRLTHETAASPDPLWMAQLEWPVIIHELGLGHPMKFIWEERAKALITYPNFWKQFYRKFPQYREATITAREFEPGERVEVDYAGNPIEWYEIKTGEIHKAYVFVSGLGFSQLLFAWAAEDMKSRNWLGCHRRMYEFYGGVSHVTVPDCLKTGVVKCHLYDPDLNEDYAYLAAHFGTAIVPARVRRPRDKAIAEGLVKILMRYFRFRFRRSRFTSIAEINRALMVCVERINEQTHRRFGVSRRERFEKIEKAALKALPSVEYDGGEWKSATLHADCYVAVDGDYYSAPHIHRHKKLRIKLTEHQVEIFLNLERLAIHPRCRQKMGQRIKILAHFPANSVAFYEATPQKLLSQSRFIHPDLNALFLELFNADVYAHIRRAMGLVSACSKEISRSGHALASEHIGTAIATMRRYNRIRTPYFQELLTQARKQSMNPQPSRAIVRRPGNPFLRYVGGAALQAPDEPSSPPTAAQDVDRRRGLTGVRRPMLTMHKCDKLTILIEKCLWNPGQSSTPAGPVCWSNFNAGSQSSGGESNHPPTFRQSAGLEFDEPAITTHSGVSSGELRGARSKAERPRRGRSSWNLGMGTIWAQFGHKAELDTLVTTPNC